MLLTKLVIKQGTFRLQGLNHWINIPLCAVGLLANLLCIAVLTRTHTHSPFNRLLLYLAVTDFLGLAVYLAGMLSGDQYHCCYTLFDFVLNCCLEFLSTLLIDNINMWLTLAMAATRYLAISQVSFRFSFKLAKRVLLAVICVSLIQKTPAFTILVIYSVENNEYFGQYRGVFDEMPVNDASYVDIAMNLVACFLLTLFSCLIISVLVKAKKRHQKITKSFKQRNTTWSQTTRTTLTILAITFSTLMCKILVIIEAICYLHFLNDSVSQCEFVNYARLFKKTLQMINSGMNIVFFVVSKDFRETLISILCCRNTCRAGDR